MNDAKAIRRGARLAIWLLAAALAAWALYLVTVGLPATSVPEVQPGEPLPPGRTVRMPYLAAVYSPLALVPVVIGTLKDRWLPLAWLGVLLHLAVGGLLIFGPGVIYVAASGVLAAPVGLLAWQADGRARWLLASAAGGLAWWCWWEYCCAGRCMVCPCWRPGCFWR